MKRIAILLLLTFQVMTVHSQVIRPFTAAPTDREPLGGVVKVFHPYAFDANALLSAMPRIPELKNLAGMKSSSATIELPLADGQTQRFFLAGDQVLAPEVAALYPQIRNFKLLSADGKSYGVLTLSQLGLNGLIVTPKGSMYISPFSFNDAVNHAIYFGEDFTPPAGLSVACGTDDRHMIGLDGSKNKTTATLGDCTLRTYDLAVAATGEYTSWAGSQSNAIASITSTIANVNLIYERDVAIHFNLITNNSLMFTNSTTDPYASALSSAVLDANTATLNSILGAANYDLGIVFNYGWNGGLAYTPAVCNATYKGGAGAGIAGAPYGPIMENTVAHELAHMFNANHTMSSGTGVSCTDNLSPTASRYEPGGGSTIMAYAGSVCSGQFYQFNSEPYFHYNSISSILNFAQTFATCNGTGTYPNVAPTLTVPSSSYTIPASTPFELTAAGTDANAVAAPTYTFEQYDLAGATMTAPPSATATSGPVIRSRPPSSVPYRVVPGLDFILAGVAAPWEVLPSVSRTLNFKVVMRDNEAGKGCVAQEDIAVNVDASGGPFAVTSQNTTNVYVADGVTTMPITWNVAGTAAAPFNAPTVDILLSTDNGQTFPHVLAAATANDGSHSVLIPNFNTTEARIKIKANGNIFFDINNAKQTITSSCVASGTTFAPADDVTAYAGSAALNLGLSPEFGSLLPTSNTFTGTLTSADPWSTTTVNYQTPGACQDIGNRFQYDLFTFQVSANGNYTFAAAAPTAFGTVYNLFEASFVPGTPCINFLNSNATLTTGVTVYPSFTQALATGITYVLAVGTFSSLDPALPAAYAINVTPPGGGGLYTGVPNPGASYAYKYVVVNNTTGNIVAISSTGDMSNAATYPAADYTIHGLSHNTSVSQATLNTYAGDPFSDLVTDVMNGVICGRLSGNTKSVTVSPAAITWDGSNSSNWSDAANWTPATLPGSTADVIIPAAGVTNEPTVNGTYSLNSIEVAAGRTVTVSSPNSLSLSGELINNGSITGTGGLILNGTAPQTITGTGSVSNLQLNNSWGATISSGVQSLSGLLSVTSGTLTTNGNLTLRSTAANSSAMVGPVGGAIAGNVNLERFISEPAGGMSTGRAWRLLTVPAKGSTNNSIYYNWQNNGASGVGSGSGVEIWGPSGTNGLSVGPLSSMRTYDNVTNAFVPVTNTQSTTLFDANTNKAFLLFVSGPYASGFIASGSDPTTLKATGELITGTASYSFTAAGTNNLQLIGNPYACPIDFDKVYLNNSGSGGNLLRKFWVWDPNLNEIGGYVLAQYNTLTSVYDYTPGLSASAQDQYIQSGQAFFVEAAADGPATVVIQENDKETAVVQTSVFRTNNGALETVGVNLLAVPANAAPVMIDGALVNCHNNLSNQITDDEDGLKFPNINESISITNGTTKLAIEGRSLYDNGDTLKVSFSGMRQRDYQLQIVPGNIVAPGLSATLYDNFLNTSAPVSLVAPTVYSFSVTGDPASFSNSRFVVAFTATPLNLNFLTVNARRKQNTVDVNWIISEEAGTHMFEVQRSNDGMSFSTIGSVKPMSLQSYSFEDVAPLSDISYYRIAAVARNASKIFSKVVKVSSGTIPVEIVTYPNPVVGNSMQVSLSGLTEGNYSLSVFSASGQKVIENRLTGAAGSSVINLNIGSLAAGTYFLRVLDDQGILVGEEKVIKQ